MTCFPPCLLSFLSHHNHHHDILKNTKKQLHFFQKKENWKEKENKKNKKTPNLSFGCELPEKLTRRALILDANSGCGGRPGPPRVYLGQRQCHFFLKKQKIGKKNKQKKQEKRKTAKSQFWLRITRKVDATGRDFGCKFRLRRSPGASERVFRPITAPFLTIFYVFHFFGVAYLWRSLNTARFSDDSRFLCLAYLWRSSIKSFFLFF